jgi:hypothetical protein
VVDVQPERSQPARHRSVVGGESGPVVDGEGDADRVSDRRGASDPGGVTAGQAAVFAVVAVAL